MATYHVEGWLKGRETEQPIEDWVEAADAREAMTKCNLPDGEYTAVKITKVEVNA